MFAMLTADEKRPHPTANQAVSCLGRSIHAGVARQIVRELLTRGVIEPGLRYGSDCSGVDLFAAGVQAELGSQWTYTFASEHETHIRAGLLSAWGKFGLTESACAWDARRPDDEMPPTVDLYVLTADCTSHSTRNHNRTTSGWVASLGDIWAMLAYVRTRRPRVIVVENVNETSIVQPLTGWSPDAPRRVQRRGRRADAREHSGRGDHPRALLLDPHRRRRCV